MKKLPLLQGGLDSLCGIYSVCNVYRIVKNAPDEYVDMLFDRIITHLAKKKMLKGVLLGGMLHKNMADIIYNVVKDDFVERFSTFKWSNYTINDFWKFSQEHLSNPNTAIILSIGGLENHYTTVYKMSDKTMFLYDSGGMKRLNKSQCKFQGYTKEDKYVIYPNQCWFIKG